MLEYLLLRRVHALEPADILKVVYSYGHLIRQNKIIGSTSIVKTLEYIVSTKWLEFEIGLQAKVLNSMFDLSRLKLVKGEKNKQFI